MLDGASHFRSLTIGVAFALFVPAAVITCGGRVDSDLSEDVTQPTRGGTGATATTQQGGQTHATTTTATATTSPTTTGTSTTAPTSTVRVFLGQYTEPDWYAQGVPTPQPSVTSTVPGPCDQRIDVCGGSIAPKTWASQIMQDCANDTHSCGNVSVAIDAQTTCIQHLTALNPYVTSEYFRCIATVAYYTRCDGFLSPMTSSIARDTCILL